MAGQKRSGRLQPVARLAGEREQQAARKLGERRQELQQQQRQLEELENYRTEYIEQLQRAARNGIGAVQLRHYQTFVGKLTEAIEQQRSVVLAAEREVALAREGWYQSHTRVKIVDSVISSCQSEEQQEAQRAEQKETDERALRASRR